MRTLIVAVAAVLVAAAPALANVGLDAPGVGPNDFRDEPNVGMPGTLPNVPYADPSASYPADANGIATAREGAAAKVLNVKWIGFTYGLAFSAGAAGLAGLGVHDTNALLERFDAPAFMLPVPRQWVAFYGTWADADGDGFRDDVGRNNRVNGHDQPVYVSGGSGDACERRDPRTDDPRGVPVAGTIGVSWRCDAVDEWEGIDGATIVGYLTPGEAADDDLFPVGLHLPGMAGLNDDPAEDMRRADLVFQTAPTIYGNGSYYAPGTYLDYTLVDSSILETTVTEVIADAVLTPDGARQYEARSGSLVDVDLYASIDPTLEALFVQTLWGAAALWNGGIESLLEDVGTADDDVERAVKPEVGPTAAGFQPAQPVEDTGRDHAAGYHMYLDLRLTESTAYSAFAAGNLGGARWISDGRGVPQNFARVDVTGYYGAWHDSNGDGFIGKPTADPGCGDAHDCGLTQDPNAYSRAESEGEFIPTCYAGAATGRFWVTLSTATGDWGPSGAYVVTDEDYRYDGRANFIPYDDMARDAADGSVDQLVFSGPLRLMVTCTNASGYYRSFEQVILPGGTHGREITMASDPIVEDFKDAGIEVPETSQDTDVTPAWTS